MVHPTQSGLPRKEGGIDGGVGPRVGRQQERLARCLAEVEVVHQVAKLRRVLADIGPGIGPAVGLRVEAGAVKEIVLDELQVGVAAQDLVVDEALLGVGGDDQPWHAQAVPVPVDLRRCHVVVEAAPVVPGQEDGGRVPVGALHGRVDDRGHVGLALVDAGGRVVAVELGRGDPGDRWQRSRLGRGEVGVQRLDVLQLVVLVHVLEQGQRIPDARRRGPLLYRGTREDRGVGAVRLGALLHVVRPAHVLGVQQPGDVGPGVNDRGRPPGHDLPHRHPDQLPFLGAADVVDAAHGRAVPALGRPGGHHVVVVGQRPGFHRLEHVVLKDEVLGVRPVVGYLRGRVIAHHVARGSQRALRVLEERARLGGGGALREEPVHLPAVDVRDGVLQAVWAAAVDVSGVVVRADAAPEGLGTHTVGTPFRIGMPSAPG